MSLEDLRNVALLAGQTEERCQRLGNERDLAIAALRLCRDALRAALNTMDMVIEDGGHPTARVGEFARRQIAGALAAADGILGSMSNG